MAILTVSLSSIQSLSDLATALSVPPAALRLVTLTSSPCRRASCTLPSCEKNNGHCIFCSQSWFPNPYNAKGESTNCRGHGLYGPQFMRNYEGRIQPGVCCCDNPLCEKIGYSHEGMFHLPSSNRKNPMRLHMVLQCLGMSKEWKIRILNKPRSYKIAPWHYHPDHREYTDGKWHLIKAEIYTDEAGNEYDFPPPNYDIKKFIKNEIPGGWFDNRLPEWAPEFIAQAKEVMKDRRSESKKMVTEMRKAKRPPNKIVVVKADKSNAPDEMHDVPIVNSVAELVQKTRPRNKRKSREDEMIKDLEDQVTKLQFKLSEAIDTMSGLRADIKQKDDELRVVKQPGSIGDLQSKLNRAKHIIENLMTTVKQKDDEIEQQKEIIEELRDEKLVAQEEKLLEEVGHAMIESPDFKRQKH